MSLRSIFGVQPQNFLWHICLYHSNCVGDLCERQRTGQRSITGKQTNKQGLWRGSIMDRKTKVIRLVAVSLFIEIHKKKKLSIEHCLLCNHIAIERNRQTQTGNCLFFNCKEEKRRMWVHCICFASAIEQVNNREKKTAHFSLGFPWPSFSWKMQLQCSYYTLPRKCFEDIARQPFNSRQ